MSTRVLASGSADDRPTQKSLSRYEKKRTGSVAAIAATILFGLTGLFPAFALMAAPAIGVDPDRVSAALAPGQSATQVLTILNQGSDPLDWQLLNQNIDVRDLRREAAITLNSSEYMLVSAVVDPAGRYAYFGTSTPPGQVIKVDVLTMERVGAIMLQDGESEDAEGFLLSAVMDPAGRYAYFGTGSYPGKVVKVDLENFERVAAVTFEPGEDVPRAAVIDPAGRFAYFATDTDPGHIVKVDLENFVRVGAIDLGPDQGYTDAAAAIDPAGQFAYFGVNFGTVLKIDLASFTLVDNIDTGVGTLLGSALIAPDGQYAYFGTHDDPGQVLKIDLANFTLSDTLTLEAGEARLVAAALSADGAFAYFGTRQTAPGRVIRVDLASFTRTGGITLNQGEDDLRAALRNPVSGDLYFAASALPGRVIKVSDSALNCALPAWANMTSSSGTVGGGGNQAVDVGINAAGLAVGQHESALCLQSNDPTTPRLVVPLVVDVGLMDIAPKVFVFDVVRGGNDSDTLSIANRGSGDLTWSIAQADPVLGCAVPATAAWLDVSPANGTVAPGGNANAGVTVDTATLPAGPYAAQLCVTVSSGADSQMSAIPVGLTVREPAPAISSTPGSLSAALSAGEHAAWDLSILNSGTAALDWTLSSASVAPRVDGILDLGDEKSLPGAAVIDSAGRYAYFGTLASPGQIVKVDLESYVRVGMITLAQGEDFVTSGVIDPAGHQAYFGTSTTPGRVVRIDLDSFQRVDAIVLEAGEDSLSTAVIDPAGAFAYFGTRTEFGKIVKVDLVNFTRVDAIDLDSSQEEWFLNSAVIDPAGAFAYFGTGPMTGKVVKIDLASFQRVGTISVADDQGTGAAIIDATGEFAYFGTVPPFIGAARLVKLDLASFQPVDTIELDLGNYEGGITAAVMDPRGRFAYLGNTWGSATRLVEVDLQNFYRIGSIPLGVVEGGLWAAVIDPAGRFAYFGGPMYPGNRGPGRVLRIEHRLECALPNWLTVGASGGSVSVGGSGSLNVSADSSGLTPGTYSADLCFASGDPVQPVFDVPVDLVVTGAGDRIFADGFESPSP